MSKFFFFLLESNFIMCGLLVKGFIGSELNIEDQNPVVNKYTKHHLFVLAHSNKTKFKKYNSRILITV